MKKVITAALLATLVSAGAMVYAAGTPVQNRQQGDLKLDVNYGFDQKMGHRDAKTHFSGGDVTYVLNDKVDLQYDNNNTKASHNGDRVNEHAVRGIYHINPYISAFGGVTRVNTKMAGHRDHDYGGQIGLEGQVPVADKVTAFGSVGIGDDVNTYEVGVGYNFNENLDAHVKYRRDDIDVNNYDNDVKGWQVGMGYKF